MRNKLLLLLLLCLNSVALLASGGGGGPTIPCTDANPFCTAISYNFPNETNTSAPSGPNYGCLSTQPNPVWYYMEVDQGGTFQIGLSQTSGPNGTGTGLDVDFAMWGPFSSLSAGCSSIMGGQASIQCSYSVSSTETLGLGMPGGTGIGASTPPAASAGQVYIVLITNFNGGSGYISFNQTGGTGIADCSIVTPCDMTNLTANPGACNPATNTYNVSGQVTFVSPPASGTLTVSSSCGGSQVFNAPFASPLNYTLTGLPSNGAGCTVTAVFSADNTCTRTQNYTAPPSCIVPPPCFFDYISTNTGACETGSVFTVDGQFSYQNNPGAGQVVVTITNSSGTWTQTFNPPFVNGNLYNYSISGITADGSPATVTINFTSSPGCTITQNITSPAACNCSADIGTFTVTTDGTVAGNNISLCFGDLLDIETNDDWTAPEIANNPPGPVYDPGVSWLIYTCPPSVALTPNTTTTIPDDPCLLGVVSDFDLNEMNDMFWINAYPPGTFANNTVYFVPITMYSITSGTYSYVNTTMPCYELGTPYAVQYLPDVTSNAVENCANGTVTVTMNGGLPQVNGSSFTGSNLLPATASFTTGSAPNGGNIVVGGLQNGDNYSFDISDGNGCSVTITGTFVGGQDASFNYAQASYCKNAANPSPVVTGTPGGTFTAAPAGLSINAGTGQINLAASTAGTYTVTYTTPGPVCPDQETFVVTINPVPTATISGTTTVCNGAASPVITFTGANATAPYTFTYTLNGGANQTIVSVGNTATINVPTGTNGTFTYTLVSVQAATGCAQNQAGSATVTVNPLPTATIAGTATVCVGAASPVITFTGSSATAPYTFTYNINGGANQTVNSVGATATINVSTAASGTFTYNLVSVQSAAGCVQPQVGSATVIVNPLPTAVIAGTVSLCANAPQPTITFTGANGTAPYTFSYNLNGGATQTIVSVGNSATISVPTSTPGTFTYNLLSVQDASSTSCAQNQAGSATVTVNANPTPVITGPATYCSGSSSTLSTTIPYTTYNWSTGANTPTINATDADNPITVTVTNAAGCSATSAVFNVTENSVITYDETITICQGQSALIHGNNETVAGLYSQTFILPTGCDSVANITLVVNPLPPVNAGVDQTVCSGTSVTLNGSGASSYVWNNGVTNNTAFSPPLGTTTYTVTGTDANGCVNTDQVAVTVNPLPTATISGTSSVCLNGPDQTITFTGANGTAPYTFTYTLNGGANQTIVSTGNTATITIPASSAGTYSYNLVSVTDASSTTCGQNQVGSATITVNPLPNVFAGNDVLICEGQTVVLTGSGAVNYAWDNGINNGIGFTPNATNTYTVIGTDANGCQNADQVLVTVDPLPIVSFVADVTSGCAPLTVTFTNTTPDNLSNCIWTFGNGTSATGCGTITTTFAQAGLFDVSLTTTNLNGCTNSVTYADYIYVEAVPVASFTPSSSVVSIMNSSVSFNNTSVNATNYVWDFGDGSPLSTIEDPTHLFQSEEPGNYTVELIANSPLGCADTAIRVIIVEDELIFYVPNTFTPDGDDFNEYFQAIFTSGYDPFDFNLYIFNRWGEIIWESHDVRVGWDGTYGEGRSELVQDGTYTWKIDFKTTMSDERVEVLGHVNVVR